MTKVKQINIAKVSEYIKNEQKVEKQIEKQAKDELVRELVEALEEHVAAFGCITFNSDHHPEMEKAKKKAKSALRKAGAYNVLEQ